jgi:hypothetical protein
MNPEKMREAAHTMQREDEPLFDALADFLLDIADDIDSGLWPADHHVPAHARDIAAAYVDDPGPVPEVAA